MLQSLLSAARLAAAVSDFGTASDLYEQYAQAEREYSELLGADLLSAESTADASEAPVASESTASQPGGVAQHVSAPRKIATSRVTSPDPARGARVYFRSAAAGVVPRHQRCELLPLASPAAVGSFFVEALS